MASENLRAALQAAGVQPDQLADIVQVDVRTVRRWLAGTTPYPRQRAKIARTLDTTEHHLWPGAVAAAAATPPASQPIDPIVSYRSLGALDAPDWKQMMRDAVEHIDLLGETLEQPLAVPGLPGLLAAKAEHGCQVRVLVSYPGPHLAPYLGREGIDVHVLDGATPQVMYRFDNQLLLILPLQDHDDNDWPLLHIRRASDGGLFDRLADHFLIVWEDGSAPIDPDHDLYNDDADDDRPEQRRKPHQTAVTESAAAMRPAVPATPPRRWPRRSA